jgi:TPR repeat protein
MPDDVRRRRVRILALAVVGVGLMVALACGHAQDPFESAPAAPDALRPAAPSKLRHIPQPRSGTQPPTAAPEAAYQPSTPAELSSQTIYDQGLAAERRNDFAAAMRLYREAADKGYPQALNRVGFMYMNGIAVTKNFAEAMRWFQLATDKGNASAANNIGWLYHNGWGVPRNLNTALQWYLKAAEKGNPVAMNNIGRVSEFDFKDVDKAVQWYRRAAAYGNVAAAASLTRLGK